MRLFAFFWSVLSLYLLVYSAEVLAIDEQILEARPLTITLSEANSLTLYQQLPFVEQMDRDEPNSSRRKLAEADLHCMANQNGKGEVYNHLCTFYELKSKASVDVYHNAHLDWGDSKTQEVAKEFFERLPSETVIEGNWLYKSEYVTINCQQDFTKYKCQVTVVPVGFTDLTGWPCYAEFDAPTPDLSFIDDSLVEAAYYDPETKVTSKQVFHYQISNGNVLTIAHRNQVEHFKIIHQGHFMIPVKDGKRQKGHFSCSPETKMDGSNWH